LKAPFPEAPIAEAPIAPPERQPNAWLQSTLGNVLRVLEATPLAVIDSFL